MSRKQQLIDFIKGQQAIGELLDPEQVARAIAFDIHGGKRRKSGAPTLLHIEEVVGDDPDRNSRIVSWLHDVPEDTRGPNGEITDETWLSDDFRAVGIPEECVVLIENITRTGAPYFDDMINLMDENLDRKDRDNGSNSGWSSPGYRKAKYGLNQEYIAARRAHLVERGKPFAAFIKAARIEDQGKLVTFLLNSSEKLPHDIMLVDDDTLLPLRHMFAMAHNNGLAIPQIGPGLHVAPAVLEGQNFVERTSPT